MKTNNDPIEIKNIVIGVIFVMFFIISPKIASQNTSSIPFSVDSSQLTIWNGDAYIPFFIKGVNLGIAKPGTSPGELEATREQYQRWFSEIKMAGFNCIRIYTLHYPHFYEELKKYNTAHLQHPLFFFQGVWLNEELDGYYNDLYQMTDTFRAEIKENIDCVHGKKTISARFGKAFGTYTANVSQWNLGYIIGREVSPAEVLTTNSLHPNVNSFVGLHFSITGASATEIWWTNHLNALVDYERNQYKTERPVSVSSWPTLDPIIHRSEADRNEDTASVDLSKIKILDAPGGFFISYHAYPYYPDFIGKDSTYKTYSDNYGTNSYLGYLIDLKKHYLNYPLIIAEFGVPSSWGIAHYSSSGMNHGGFDEQTQGETNIRMLNTIKNANLGGGIHFSWLDEWFKRTWITDPLNFLNRPLWHNITSAEQNFGLKKFIKKGGYNIWKTFKNEDDIQNIKALSNFDFFQMEIGLKEQMDILGECWIGFDTYDETLGESLLPNGQTTLPFRSEFALHITQHSADLYVTQAYDLFGNYHKETTPEQKFQSTTTNGGKWNLVRWKNNNEYADVQYIGSLKINKGFQPKTSKDAVTIYDKKIEIRIPWTLLHVVDPSQKRIFHDDLSTQEIETRITDGIAVSLFYKNNLYQTDNRFVWENWTMVKDTDVIEEFKTSYWTMYDRLVDFNSPAIAFTDSFDLSLTNNNNYSILATEGLLINDFDPDGDVISSVLVETPKNGFIDLNTNGSFTYIPINGFRGIDTFKYCLFDGQSLSKANVVKLHTGIENKIPKVAPLQKSEISLYPNPANDYVTIESNYSISSIQIFDISGKLMETYRTDKKSNKINISKYNKGIYILVSNMNGKAIANKLVIN